MSTELERFCILFDRLVIMTREGLAATATSVRTWKPTENISIGTRIKAVTIKSLFIHQVVTEHLWIQAAATCEEGASMPKPSAGMELTERLNEGDYLGEAERLHAQNMELLRGFSEATLNKKVEFVGRTWTVMGFLWSMYGHHSYHLGHIDMFWRLSDHPGPDFHQFNPPEMA